VDDTPVVWSSDGNAGDRKPGPASPRPAPAGPPNGPARVRLERQGRGGKVVSVVDNLTGHPARIEEIAKTLKSKCGAGGTVKGRVVEIQGDHRDRIVEVLASLGIASKRAGG
jgi:translation initiation factor 1